MLNNLEFQNNFHLVRCVICLYNFTRCILMYEYRDFKHTVLTFLTSMSFRTHVIGECHLFSIHPNKSMVSKRLHWILSKQKIPKKSNWSSSFVFFDGQQPREAVDECQLGYEWKRQNCLTRNNSSQLFVLLFVYLIIDNLASQILHRWLYLK